MNSHPTKNRACIVRGDHRRRGWRILALCVPLVTTASLARADMIQIPAVSFALRTANLTVDTIGESNNGTLTAAKGIYFAAVPFPINGAKVCRFLFTYRDNDADFQLTARLRKKPIVIGSSPFDPPVTMATLNTGKATASAGVLRRSSNIITQPVIDLINAFYFVQIDSGATTLEIIGAQVEHKPSCP